MNDIIVVKPEKCVGCNACIRNCPAPEANITKMLENGKYITAVNSDKCIGCGQCIRTCTHNARDYIDDTRMCMQRLTKDKTIILVSPAIRTAFPNHWVGILDWFKSKGCIIYDVSFGADISTWAHLRAFEGRKISKVISQSCPAVIRYIHTYEPSIIKNISPVLSPVGCIVAYIKKYLRRTNPIAVLSPCIAQKTEFTDSGLVEYNITFRKLKEYFDSNGIVISAHADNIYDYQFDDQQGQFGTVYTRPGGMKDNLLLHDSELNILNSEGVFRIYDELGVYANIQDVKRPELFDILSCEFGCNHGPASASKSNAFDSMHIMKQIEGEAKKRRKTGVFRPGEDKLFKKFDEELVLDDFLKSFKSAPPSPVLSEKQLDAVYKLMGKETESDKHYDCRACGYNSCHDMATAICRGLNYPSNCVVYTKKELAVCHDELKSKEEKNNFTKASCFALSNELCSKIDNIKKNLATISESTNKTSDRAKVVNDLLTNIITFCKNNEILTSDSISQMIVILETTLKAFSALDDNISATNQSSAMINQSVSEVKELIESINKTLSNTSDSDADENSILN